jgi:large subunit ribosomal protein LP2
MKHVAAYALLVLGGNNEPSAEDVNKVLKEAGTKADEAAVAKLISALKGKAFHEIVTSGLSAIGAAGPAAGAVVATAAKVEVEVKEEAPVEEEEEEVDMDMGGLFGDDY